MDTDPMRYEARYEAEEELLLIRDIVELVSVQKSFTVAWCGEYWIVTFTPVE